jgi:uncharacterized protein YjiS (DUF1127 family)
MGTTVFDGGSRYDGRDHSRRAVSIARPRAGRDDGALRAASSLASRRVATASDDIDGVKTQRLFWGTRIWRWCARCSARSRQRDALSSLEDRLLEDIGVTRQQAIAEAAKPFWK